MFCEKCHKNQATVHIKEMTGDQVKVLHLCSECAGAAALPEENAALNLAEILYKLAAGAAESMESSTDTDVPSGQSMAAPDSTETETVCPGCGLTLAEFRKTGRLGCGDCYPAFAAALEDVLRDMHRGTVHRGRRPESGPPTGGGPSSRERAVARLREELSRAVAVEAYERAAELRDEIRRAMSN
ncbi:MAG: hypothetical protein GXP31_16935 [Kiritimatiellaeota bacterium]|nr:hypothetical protein [Kiritimatiellota bacterium]